MNRAASFRLLLRALACGLALAAAAPADDRKPATAAPAAQKPAATPAPGARRKTQAEMEAEQEEAVDDTVVEQKEESYFVTEPLGGVWQSTDGAARRLEIKPNGAYTLSGAEGGAGFIEAYLGRYKRRAAKGAPWVEGRYRFRSIDELETEGPLGQTVWRRVK